MADERDETESNKPSLKVVSENPAAREDRERQRAKDEAQRLLTVAAATMLRAIAGSDGAAAALRNDMIRALMAEDEYQALSGQWLASWERQKAIALPQPKWDHDDEDRYHRAFERASGIYNIVRGSLRLAAHQVLDEEPHFGGKHSEQLIEFGMNEIERANRAPPEPVASSTRNRPRAEKTTTPDRRTGATGLGSSSTRKRWSSRDSRSYRDPIPEE